MTYSASQWLSISFCRGSVWICRCAALEALYVKGVVVVPFTQIYTQQCTAHLTSHKNKLWWCFEKESSCKNNKEVECQQSACVRITAVFGVGPFFSQTMAMNYWHQCSTLVQFPVCPITVVGMVLCSLTNVGSVDSSCDSSQSVGLVS